MCSNEIYQQTYEMYTIHTTVLSAMILIVGSENSDKIEPVSYEKHYKCHDE